MSSEQPNVFLSWSGQRSKLMAEALHGFLRRVIQSARPFFSDKDIEAGAPWDAVLKQNIREANFAIVCCTPENLTSAWLNYEAGAISDRLDGRTAPLILGAKPAALGNSPLSRFQAREADKAGTFDVVRALNSNLVQRLDDAILSEAFEVHWEKFEEKLDAIPAPEAAPGKREPTDMLEEVVGLCRQLSTNSQNGWIEYALQSIGRVESMLDRAFGMAYPGPNISGGSVVFTPSLPSPLGAPGAQGPQGPLNLSSNFHLGLTGAHAPGVATNATFFGEIRNRVHHLLAERGYAAMPPSELLAEVTAEITSKRLTPSAEFDAVVIRLAEQRGLIPRRS